MRPIAAAALAVLLLAPAAARAEEGEAPPPYKQGESWPLRNFRGLDFAEPLLPLAAWRQGDYGRIAFNTALPLATLASAFIFRPTDDGTLREISKKTWGWEGIDQGQDNVPFEFAMVGLSIASILIPSPEDAHGVSCALRLDRATVLALSYGASRIEVEVLKRVIRRARPDNFGNKQSRPSGHAAAAGCAAAFTSDVIRDALRPQDETSLGLRVGEEALSFLPYLGAAYMSLERVHARKHFLTDALLGTALGAITTHMFYAWSFTREEERGPWIELASVGWDPERQGIAIAFAKSF